MGEDNVDFEYSSYVNYTSRREATCAGLISEEDYHQTTVYPACGCNSKYCGTFKGYCPVRD